MSSLLFIGIIIMIVTYGFTYSLESPKYDLTIGMILGGKDDIAKKVAALAIQIANNELSDFNFKLQIKTETIEDNSSFNSIRKACSLLENGLVAIISTVDAISSRHISSICNKFSIPHLITSCRFPESLEGYSMDVRVSPDCSQYADIIFQYITKIENWRSMIIIHSYNDCILKFESLINQFEYKMKMRQWVHHDLKKNKDLMRELSKSNSHHTFIVDIPFWEITEFLIMASVHNMTGPQYSFIFTDWDASLVDIAVFKINNQVNITSFSIINQTSIDQMNNRGVQMNNLIVSIIETERSIKNADIKPKLLSRPAIIFDSILLLSKGLIKLAKFTKLTVKPLHCISNNTWKFGPSLINSITSIDDFYGTTGKIIFNENAQRKEYNLSIMELTENGYENSSYWSKDKFLILPKIISPSFIENVNFTNPLRVTTKIEIPFVFYHDPKIHENFDPNPSSWKGYCIDLLEKIGDDLKLNFSIHVVADNSYGASNETNPDGTEKWTGMIGELMTKKADLAVAPMTITYEREKVVDFTTPFMSLGLSILFLRPKTEAPGLFSFLSPLTPTVWVYVIGAYVGVSLILFVISHITPYERLHSHICQDDKRKENQFNILNSLWFSVGALVRQGCDLAPQASSTRIIVGVWWFFTLIIISTYTANLAAFLTVEQLILPIKGAEDLANQTKIKYGTLRGGASQAFFQKALIPTYQKMYKFMEANDDVLIDDVDKGINRVLTSGGKYAFLMESSWIDYYVQQHCNLMRVGDLLDSKGYGIGLPEGSPLRDKMSVSILKLQKEQVLENIKHKWWTEMNISEPCNTKEQGKIPERLNVYQVGGVFLLLGGGFIVGILISILEVYIRYYVSQYKIPFSKYMSKELKFAMRFMSSSKKLKRTDNKSNQFRKNINIIDQAMWRDNDVTANVHLTRPLVNISDSPNFCNRRQMFIDLDNTDNEQNELYDSSLEGISNKFPWNQHNNI